MAKNYNVESAAVLKSLPLTRDDEHLQKSEEILLRKSEEGWTPLHVAVITSDEKTVSNLISTGAELTEVDVDGRTPVHWSAFRDVSFRVFELITQASNGRIFEQQDRYGRTPLHYICLNERTGSFENNEDMDIHEAVRKLQFVIDQCKNMEQRDTEGNTPLLLLCKNIHNFATFEEISYDKVFGVLRNSDFKSRSICGITLEMFLKRGANVLAQNDYGVSPLHAACKANCVEIVQLLISELQRMSESQPNTQNNAMDMIGNSTDACGNTPMLSVFKGHMCKSLQYTVPDPSPWSYVGYHKHRFQDSLRPILKHMRSTVNTPKAASGSTVLHYALADQLCSSDVVKGLIGYGKADVNARNYLGKTPIHYAILPDLSHNPKEYSDFLTENRKVKVNLLLGNGADVNAGDWCGCTPLHDAVESGDSDLVGLLLQNKANVHAVNKYGDTPLHFTNFCQKDSEDVYSVKCRLLEASGKEITPKSELNGNSTAQVHELLSPSMNEIPPEQAPHDTDPDTYLFPVHMNAAEEWFQENPTKWTLTDQKIQELLQTSNSKSLSNDPSQNVVLEQTMNLMRAVFQEVANLDRRFEVSVELSGSTREGSKVDKPDEFDVLCFLESFQTICEVEESEQGFVRCKLCDKEDGAAFVEFFDDLNFLNGSKLTSVLYCHIKKSLGHPFVCQSAPGLTLGVQNHEYDYEDGLSGILCLHLVYTDEKYRYMPISVDVVPAIRKRNWWPTFARQKGKLVNANIKLQGCMVIPKPKTEVTLSGERIKFLRQFKVSVYLSECSILTSLPEPILDAYKLAKLLLRQTTLYPPLYDIQGKDISGSDDIIPDLPETEFHPSYPYLQSSFSSYMLKNALLYELDEECLLEQLSLDKIDIKETPYTMSLLDGENKEPPYRVTRCWTARIFRRLLKISKGDEFLPYYLPTNSLFSKRGPNTMMEIQETFYKLIIAILQGTYAS